MSQHTRHIRARCFRSKFRFTTAVFWAIAFAFFASLSGTNAFGGQKRGSSAESVATKVLRIAQRLPGSTIDEATPLTNQIQALILGDLDAWAKSRQVNFVEVRERLEQDLSELRDPLYGRASGMDGTWGHRRVVVAGYSFGWGKYDRINVITLYGVGKAGTRRLATASFVPRTNLHFLPVEAGPWSGFRFVAYGTRPGMSEPRLTAALFGFDGKQLKMLWERKDAFAGKIAVSGDFLTLRYVDVKQYVNDTQGGGLPPAHEAIYRFTPTGLLLQTTRNIRFP